jgi:uncharacterized cupin superfamily protein
MLFSGLVALSTAGAVSIFHSSLSVSTVPAAAAEGAHPGITAIARGTLPTEVHAFPPEMRVGTFDGAFKLATVYRSAGYPDHKVAFFESEPGVLQADNFAVDEFVYVLEGDLVTTDASGARHEFHAGDTFVLPKGWAGTWDMKTHFRKMVVDF